MRISSYILASTVALYCTPKLAGATEDGSRLPPPRQRDFAALEITKNDSMIHSQNHLTGAKYTYFLGFRHMLSEQWMMGVGMNFKSFYETETHKSLSFLTLTHESYFLVRLFQPNFLMVGPKILYMLPTERTGFPISRQTDYQTEIGAGLSLGLLKFFTPKLIGSVRIDRWRGTKTNRFHGVEFGAGMSFALP